MRRLALALAAASALAAAPAKAPDGTADDTQLKLAEYAVKTPTQDLEPALASAFLKLDPETLPKRLRLKARAKQLEVRSLVKLSEGKKKGGIRWMNDACEVKEYAEKDIPALKLAQYAEVEEDEIAYCTKRTQCTERDMQCEFSLAIARLDKPDKRGRERRLFLMDLDPLFAIIGEYRAEKAGGSAPGQTKFFGIGALTCARNN